MNLLFIISKVIISLYLTVAIIFIIRAVRDIIAGSISVVKDKMDEMVKEMEPEDRTRGKVMYTISTILIFIIIIIHYVLIRSTFRGLQWPITLVKIIRGE